MASAWAALLPVGHAGKEELLLSGAIGNDGSGPTFCFLGVVGGGTSIFGTSRFSHEDYKKTAVSGSCPGNRIWLLLPPHTQGSHILHPLAEAEQACPPVLQDTLVTQASLRVEPHTARAIPSGPTQAIHT